MPTKILLRKVGNGRNEIFEEKIQMEEISHAIIIRLKSESFSGLQKKRTQGICERVYGIDFLMLQMVCKVKEMNVLLCVRVE